MISVKAIAKHLGVDEKQIMSHHIYEDHVAVVVDNGIKGCPKYIIPMLDLTDKPIMKEEPGKVIEDKPVTVQKYTGKRGRK